ncbi:unnamed protein product [Acanthocheilonema viteae]|uniref:C3H1-type domain-containing protein n=1 Tax=Acanthocheilonema viteae TaxID=6277 RepID=A0A498SP41_ACAVI|nr:unnamed protein product [Acanthocheilonema viteae]
MIYAISLFKARIRACSPNSGAPIPSTSDACRLEILANAHFLSNIKIAKLTKISNEKEPNIQYSNASTDIATLEAAIGNNLNATSSPSTVPYPVTSQLNFMQQLAFPFRLDITSPAITPDTSAVAAAAAAAAAVFNIAAAANVTTHASMLQHATPTITFDPYTTAQVAAAATQLLQEQHEFQQVMQQLKVNNCNSNDTINGYHQNESNVVEEDSKSHKEAKIEVFSEDEDDYSDGEDVCAFKKNGEKNSWGMEGSKNLDENTNFTFDATEYVNEYPPLPTAGSGSPLCYSAVVKGIKPLNNNNNNINNNINNNNNNNSNSNNKPSFNSMKECSNATSQQNTSTMSFISTQISQWDQMVFERGGKFNKPAPQCIHWNNPKHRLDFPCRFWHPREQCRYYPNCSNTADECGFAHPFCGDFCRCPKGKRDPQKNHRIPEERYFGSGDRMKYSANNGTR